jgi:hypothetical protein
VHRHAHTARTTEGHEGARLHWHWPIALSVLSLIGVIDSVSATELRLAVEMVVPVIQRLEIEPAVITAPSITSSDLALGYMDLEQPVVLTIHSNTSWELSIREPDDGSRTTGASSFPPLLWSRDGRNFSALSEQWIAVASGAGSAAGAEIRLQLRIHLGWTRTTPGTYEPRLEYRLSPSGG